METFDAKKYVKTFRIDERVPIYEKFDIRSNGFERFNSWTDIKGVLSRNDIINLYNKKGIDSNQIKDSLKQLDEEEISIVSECIERTEWYQIYKGVLFNYDNELEKGILREEDLDISIAFVPFVRWIINEVKKVQLKNIVLSVDVIKNIAISCSNILMNLVIKTIVWDFRSKNIKDGNDESDNDLLKQYLSEQFGTAKNIEQFYGNYPVCARRVTQRMVDLRNHYIEFITRVDESFRELQDKFKIPDCCNELSQIEPQKGDTHQQGRSVIEFFLGGKKMIYKPRNILCEQKFFEIINDFCNKNNLLDLHSVEYLVKSDYAFESFASYMSCTTEKQVESFYIRLGQLCAFVYLFGGNDIHYENIIASGEYPIIIDMETLFQHTYSILDLRDNAYSSGYKKLVDSIEITAILPLEGLANNHKGMDISALNGKGGELPYSVLQLVDARTDNIRFEKKNVYLAGKSNIPMLNGKKVDFMNYRREILKGLKSVFIGVIKNKEYFLGMNGKLKDFKNMTVRQLLRSTISYANMMDFSSHPNYSLDMVMLEKMLSNVWGHPYKDKRVVIEEISDMLAGDIPFFYKQVNGKDLFSSRDNKLKDYFDVSGYELVESRFQNFDKTEMERQISHAIVCLELYEKENEFFEYSIMSKGILSYSNKNIIDTGLDIVDKIIKSAYTCDSDNSIDWLGCVWDKAKNKNKITSIGYSYLYGSVGLMVLFLRASKYNKQLDVYAKRIVNELLKGNLDNMEVGITDGLSGILFGVCEAYKLSGSDVYKMAGKKIIRTLIEKISNVTDISFEYGILGVINVLCEAHKVFNLRKCEDIEAACDRLYFLGKEVDLKKIVGTEYVLSKAIQYLGKDMIPGVYIDKEREEMHRIYLYKRLFNLEELSKKQKVRVDCLRDGLAGLVLLRTFENESMESARLSRILVKNKAGLKYKRLPGYDSVQFYEGLAGIAYALFAVIDMGDTIPLITI